jgi:hypothetical protein
MTATPSMPSRRELIAATTAVGTIGLLTAPQQALARDPSPPPPPVVSADDGYINVMAFGAKGNVGDDTAAIQAAAVAAKATAGRWGSKGLYFPPGGVYVSTQPIDFRGISTIKCEGWLVYRGAVNDVCFKVGQPSQNTGGNYYFFGLYSLSVSYNQMRHPLIQFSGLRGARAQIGSCNSFVEVYGDCTDNAYASTAWSEFHLGQTWRLEIRDNATNRNAWVNTNQFYGGALCQLRIGGPWLDVVSIVNGGGVARIETSQPHNFSSGKLVEMYNGTPADMQHGLVTVVDATHFDTAGNFSGAGWRCMGPPGYPHNDNTFYNPDIEDAPAIVHIQGQCNRLLGCRLEATGQIIFGPDGFMNSVEVSNTTHGRIPAVGEGIDMTMTDYSNGKNFTGWVRFPKAWGVP